MNTRWVARNRPPAPIPRVFAETGLPRGQKALVFLPHSDDGRYIGGSLYFMNKMEGGVPRNDMRIVVVSPGHRGVEGDESDEEKARIRREEGLCWGEMLGFRPKQMLFMNAHRTYEGPGTITPEDQTRMDTYVAKQRPTMVFVPHISDTAQTINFSTRKMVLKAVSHFMDSAYDAGDTGMTVIVMEYPTNHVPLLPPSDKNFVIAFTEPTFADIKHAANLSHRTQETKGFDIMGKLVEAIDAVAGADDQIRVRMRGGNKRLSEFLTEVDVNPMLSRGEHFGVTRLRIRETAKGKQLVEERIVFPLSAEDLKAWTRH